MMKFISLAIFAFFITNSTYCAQISDNFIKQEEINYITTAKKYYIFNDKIVTNLAWEIHPNDIKFLEAWSSGNSCEIRWAKNKEYPFLLVSLESKESLRVKPHSFENTIRITEVNPILGTLIFQWNEWDYPFVQTTWTTSWSSALQLKLLTWESGDQVIFAKTGDANYPVVIYNLRTGNYVKANLNKVER